MNFNVYLDEDMARRLSAEAKRRGTSRNRVIRDAVRDWLDRSGAKGWPDRVLSFRGDPGFEPLESRRAELASVKDDPFTDD